MDEAAFQDQLAEIIDAALPQAGQLVLLTTARQGARASRVFLGCLERPGVPRSTFLGVPTMQPDTRPGFGGKPRIVHGLRSWRSARGFCAIRLHYSANPHKSRKEWIERTKAAYTPAGWQREMEIDWSVSAGEAFYPSFAETPWRYVRDDLDDQMIDGPVYCGWDFGLTHPAVLFLQYAWESQTVYVLREMLGEVDEFEIYNFRDLVLYLRGQLEYERLAERPLALRQLELLKRADYPEPPWFAPGTEFVDLTGPEVRKRRPGSDPGMVTSDAEVLGEAGIQINVRMTFQLDRTRIMRKLLLMRANGRTGLYISRRGCPVLIQGLGGGIICKRATAAAPDPTEPAKDNVYSHLHEALGYVLVNTVPVSEVDKAIQRAADEAALQSHYTEARYRR